MSRVYLLILLFFTAFLAVGLPTTAQSHTDHLDHQQPADVPTHTVPQTFTKQPLAEQLRPNQTIQAAPNLQGRVILNQFRKQSNQLPDAQQGINSETPENSGDYTFHSQRKPLFPQTNTQMQQQIPQQLPQQNQPTYQLRPGQPTYDPRFFQQQPDQQQQYPPGYELWPEQPQGAPQYFQQPPIRYQTPRRPIFRFFPWTGGC